MLAEHFEFAEYYKMVGYVDVQIYFAKLYFFSFFSLVRLISRSISRRHEN